MSSILSNAFKISVRFGHMHELLDEAFFAPIAGLRAIKPTATALLCRALPKAK